jgi:hypothetical protein
VVGATTGHVVAVVVRYCSVVALQLELSSPLPGKNCSSCFCRKRIKRNCNGGRDAIYMFGATCYIDGATRLPELSSRLPLLTPERYTERSGRSAPSRPSTSRVCSHPTWWSTCRCVQQHVLVSTRAGESQRPPGRRGKRPARILHDATGARLVVATRMYAGPSLSTTSVFVMWTFAVRCVGQPSNLPDACARRVTSGQ